MERSPIPTALMVQESRLVQVFYNNMKRLEERRKKEKESQSQMKFFIKAKPPKDETDPEYACIAVDDCSICCERDALTNMFRTPCGHYFHRSCLQIWCDHNDSCPNCRQANPFNKTQRKIDFNQSCPSIDFAGQRDTLHNPYINYNINNYNNNINNYNINNYNINNYNINNYNININ